MKRPLVMLGAAAAAALIGSCGDPDPCVPAFRLGDRLQITLTRVRGAQVDADCTALGIDVGTTFVITLDEPNIVHGEASCSGFRAGLSPNGFHDLELISRGPNQAVGGFFDATFKGKCKGDFAFSLIVFSIYGPLPIRTGTGDISGESGAFVDFNIRLTEGCPRMDCTNQFAVDVERL